MKRPIALIILSVAIVLGGILVAWSPPAERWIRGLCVGIVAVVAFAIWRGDEA